MFPHLASLAGRTLITSDGTTILGADDKAGVAALLASLKAIVDSGAQPLIDCHPLFTITEEVGSGAAAALPWDVSEFVGIDIAPVAPGQQSSEHCVSVALQDSGGPYDYHLSRHLLRLAGDAQLTGSALMAGRAQVTLKPRLQPAIGPRPTEAPAENRQLP